MRSVEVFEELARLFREGFKKMSNLGFWLKLGGEGSEWVLGQFSNG